MPNERYHVVDQNFASTFGPEGLHETVEVRFETSGGTVSSVVVDRDDYTAENVNRLILNWVDEIEAVEQL